MMQIKKFLYTFFFAVGLLFTFRVVATQIDKEISFEIWYIFLAALVFSAIYTWRNTRRGNV